VVDAGLEGDEPRFVEPRAEMTLEEAVDLAQVAVGGGAA